MFKRVILSIGCLLSSMTIYAATYFTAPTQFLSWSSWYSLIDQMDQSTDQVLIINYQGDGGYVDIGAYVQSQFARLQTQGKIIIINLTGDAWSAHAFTACAADSIVFNNHYLVFHKMTQFGRVLVDQASLRDVEQLVQGCINKNLLTRQDIYAKLLLYEIYVKESGGQVQKIYKIDPRN